MFFYEAGVPFVISCNYKQNTDVLDVINLSKWFYEYLLDGDIVYDAFHRCTNHSLLP